MGSGGDGKVKGSFDAVVQPLDFHLDGQRGILTVCRFRRMRRLAAELRAGIEREVLGERATRGGLREAGVTSPGWHLPQGTRACAAHILVERRNFLLPLLEFAAEQDGTTLDAFYRGESRSRYRHLLDHDINSGIYVPADFERPFYVTCAGLEREVSVGSSVRLEEELASLGKRLGAAVERRFEAMKEFVRASSGELRSHQGDARFWRNFSYVVLRKLTRVSLEAKCPIIFR